MISDFRNKTAVLTGAGSGFGLECARIGAKLGMNLVLADVQQDALDRAVAEMESVGAQVLGMRVDVSKADQMEALGAATLARFGAPHLVFNNAGVGSGGLIWENSLQDWEWVIGVNLMGVAHGIRVFTPMMLAAAEQDAAFQGHIVNTASMAGLLNAPNMGIYNVSKHAVVSMSETLYQDLALVTDQISASVLCPFFVPTGITESHRNRPDAVKADRPTRSQMISVWKMYCSHATPQTPLLISPNWAWTCEKRYAPRPLGWAAQNSGQIRHLVFNSSGKILMGNSIVTEADRKATPAPKPPSGMSSRTGGHGQRVSLERGVSTRSKKNPGKRAKKGG